MRKIKGLETKKRENLVQILFKLSIIWCLYPQLNEIVQIMALVCDDDDDLRLLLVLLPCR